LNKLTKVFNKIEFEIFTFLSHVGAVTCNIKRIRREENTQENFILVGLITYTTSNP